MSTKITALPPSTGLVLTDIFPVVDDPGGVPVTQKATFAQLQTLLATGGPFVLKAGDTMTGPLNMTAGQSYQYNSTDVIRAQTALSNFFFGNSGNLTMTGSFNTAVGGLALPANTTGGSNTAIGFAALLSNTTGLNNTAIGYAALGLNTTGVQSTAIGVNALLNSTTASFNTAIGYQALYSNTTGELNVAIGFVSMFTNTTGGLNAAIGYESLFSNTTGTNNNATGYRAGYDVTTGSTNVFSGFNTGRGITTGSNNTILGASITGLAAALTSTVILAAGGSIRFYSNSAGLSGIATAVPNSTLHVQGSLALAYVAKTAVYTATVSDYTIDCTANTFTVSLPTAVGITGRIYVVKNSGAGTITIDPSGAETIDGAATATLVAGASITTQSTGANWIII